MSRVRTYDERSWDDVCDIYKRGWIRLASSRRPHIPQWLDTILNKSQGMPDSGHIPTGFRLNFADMQRIYMRQLQIRLINIAPTQQFRGADKDDITLRTLAKLGPILRKYERLVCLLCFLLKAY